MLATTGNWEAEQLEERLSRRAAAVRGAYWGPAPRMVAPVTPIALTGGIPDSASLPVEELIEASNRVLRTEGEDALRYGGPQGYPGLREWIAADIGPREGIELGPENVTITVGSAGALANVCDAFLGDGDVALIESASFPGTVRTMHSCLAETVCVAMDGQGIVPERLEDTIERLAREGRRAKLLYTIANFHNPTGVTLSLDRRHAIVEICRRHDVLIVEDDAYGSIRFEGERLPMLFTLAGGEGAVYVGTFSKTIATGLRIGWTLASKPVTSALVRMRFDMGASPWLQRTIVHFAADGNLDRHIGKVSDVYRRKRDAMTVALQERCARHARWQLPEGGFFLWVEVDPDIDQDLLAEAAVRHGVEYVRGDRFCFDGSGANFIRLAYSYVVEDEIPEAVMRLGRALEEAAAARSG